MQRGDIMKKYLCNNKGQDFVEFAIILAFAVFVGILAKDELMTAAGALLEPTKVVLAEIDHHRTYGVEAAFGQIESIMQNNAHYYEGNSYNKMDWRRGMIRSGWVDKFEDDASLSEIKNLYDEVGASQWSYLHGLGNNYKQSRYNNPNKDAGMYVGDKGLYWTNQDLTQFPFTTNSTSEKHNYALELVLQYFYSSYTKRYYVIKSHVWINQGDTTNGIALAALHQIYNKPAGYFVEGCVEGFATLEEAKLLFEKTRLNHTYVYSNSISFSDCVVFSCKEDAVPPNGVGEKDLCATDYAIKQDSSGNWSFVYDPNGIVN